MSSINEKQQPNLSAHLLTITFSVGLTLGSGFAYGLSQAPSVFPNWFPSGVIRQAEIGLAEYQRLKPGMTLTEAEAILGRGIEVESTDTSAIYKWTQLDGSSLSATFANGKLTKKTQHKLK